MIDIWSSSDASYRNMIESEHSDVIRAVRVYTYELDLASVLAASAMHRTVEQPFG